MKPKFIKGLVKAVVGLGLVIFALVPTPDDVTVISPVLCFSTGTGLITFGLDDMFGGK